MTVYTFAEARRNLSAVLDEARQFGAARIRQPDGSTFLIQPERSPLDVGGIDTDLTPDEIVSFVREGRERPYHPSVDERDE